VNGTGEDEQRRLLLAAVRRSDLPLEQLWLRYFGLGGVADLVELEDYLGGLLPLPPSQRDVLAHAVNERLDELAWRPRAPYSRALPEVRPQHGPLAALAELLEGVHRAAPERLPALVAQAGLALDVGAVLYLIDDEQGALVPLGDDARAQPLGVDSTLPGRAFRDVRVIAADSESGPRLWLPVLDCEERLGVLEVRVGEPERLADRSLREQLGWVAALVGHLVTATSRFGDALDSARRRQPRTPAAELVWSLLPPLTASAGGLVLAGQVEPAHSVGGDGFDYALSERIVQLGIFDGMGHCLDAGLRTAAALSAYRSARRDGQGLYGQARAVDETLQAHVRGEGFVTGVLAEIDPVTGRLRYLSAGHPEPLLMRAGRVVKTLAGGRRLPFGRGGAELTIAEEALQPGDWLVLHTDGVTQARDPQGTTFGRERLVDLLEREAAAAHPPPETVRRVTRAVLEHQRGVLQDDATVLLARWDAAVDGR
jgi:serine phosphatase RsbU (regulator of sigma subunit)